MATDEELDIVIAKFAQNFEQDAFLVFDSTASINFMGNILLNYKGLRIVKCHKSQLMPQ